jgi:single-stranded DNA-binding protein
VAINQTAVDLGLATTDFSTGETADEVTWLWEKAWTELMQNVSRSLPPGVQVYYANGRR